MADILVAMIIFTLAIIGIISSIYSIKIIHKTTFLHNAFGTLSGAQAIADSGVCICYGIYAAVLCLLPSEEITPENYAFGLFSMYFNCFAEMLLLTKTANRFCAVIWPLIYHQKFTIKVAVILISIEATIAALNMVPYISTGCFIYFNKETLYWMTEPGCINPLSGIFHRGIVIIVIIGTVVFDGTTLCYLLAFRKKFKNNNSKKHQREKKLFFQTFSITLVHIAALSFMYFFTRFTSSKFGLFLLRTPPFLIFHVANEFTFVLVNLSFKSTSQFQHSTTPPVKVTTESRASSKMITIT